MGFWHRYALAWLVALAVLAAGLALTGALLLPCWLWTLGPGGQGAAVIVGLLECLAVALAAVTWGE